MNNVKVSILVPVYGAENFIERCAESLFNQTYDNVEFVFVNDCTLDKSIEILRFVLRNYPRRWSQIKIIDHDENRGVASTRNTLLLNATGDYILWVDADDFIVNDAVEILVKKVSETNADIVCHASAIHTVYGVKPLPFICASSSNELIADVLAGRSPSTLWGRMFKRSLFMDNKISFVDGLNVGEDMLVLVKLIYFSKKIVYENMVLYHYYFIGNQSLTRSFSVEKTVAVISIFERLESFLKDKVDMSVYITEMKFSAYLSLIYGACIANDVYNYKLAKSAIANIDWRHVKNRKSSFYLFFPLCNSYIINRIWAYIMWALKSCSSIEKQVVGKLGKI